MPRLPLLLALLLPLHLQAQIKTPDAPSQTAVPTDAPLNPALPTVFIVGDSTARNGASLGWGDHFAHYFDTSRINVANRAVAGRSSRTYLNEGRWDKVLAELKPGDFVLLQMGHNDGGGNAASVLADTKARTTIHSLANDETVEVPIVKPYTSGPLAGKASETVHTYGFYTRKFIAEARAKGAVPILLTPTIRNIWTAGPDGQKQIERDMGFRDFDLQLATETHTPLADMATLAADRLQALGAEKTAALYPIDHTHTSPEGAEANASDVTAALRKVHSPLAAYLK